MKKTLPAGKYWIGDPCYVLDKRDTPTENFRWDQFVDFCFDGDPTGRKNEGIVDHQGITFAFFGTEYGDGCYPDNLGNHYGVDAGMIGCIPVDNIEVNSLGTVHTFDKDFDCEYDNGTIRFGHVTIKTGGEDW